MAKENHLSYKPTTYAAEAIERLRGKFIELDDLINSVTRMTEYPNDETLGRYRSLALTHLENSRIWAVNAVVRSSNEGPNEYQGTVSGDAQAA